MSVGSTLRDARVASGLSIEDVSQVTRIRAVMIEAIEEDDFSLCGGTAYAKGQIKSIASAVGLDPEDVAAEFAGLAPRRTIGSIPEEITEPADLERQHARRTAMRWTVLAVLLLLVVIFVVLWRVFGS